MSTRVTAAVERAVDDRQREATEEVERILAAAVRVMVRFCLRGLGVTRRQAD